MKMYVVCKKNYNKYEPVKIFNSKIDAEEYIACNSSNEELYIDEVESRIK